MSVRRAVLCSRTLLSYNNVNTTLYCVQYNQCRWNRSGFLQHLDADRLWKSVTTKSNQALSSPRGKRTSKTQKKDLNRGQNLGDGKYNMLWPGLNSPVIRGRDMVDRQRLPENPERMKKLIEFREMQQVKKRRKFSPIERGWSGGNPKGQFFGPPDPIGDDKFEGFDSSLLAMSPVSHMEAKYGRVRSMKTLVFIGNKDGLCGFSIGRAPGGHVAIHRGKNRAAKKLMYIDRCDGHTVYHDFHVKFGCSDVYVWKQPEGTGLDGHRTIKRMCELIGIKNLKFRVEGSVKNYHNTVRAFLYGLLTQRTHQQLADETGLYVVETREECDNFPRVIASPKQPNTDIQPHEIPDYDMYVQDGKVVDERTYTEELPFYTKLPGWQTHLKKHLYSRNFEVVKHNMRVANDGKLFHHMKGVENNEYIVTQKRKLRSDDNSHYRK